jgi:hypothetical protein
VHAGGTVWRLANDVAGGAMAVTSADYL